MLESMPSGMLGAYTGLVFGLVFVVRKFVLRKVVDNAPLIEQAKKQFFWEYGMALTAGVLIVLLNNAVQSVPLINGIVYFFGFVSFGFFIAIDMSLQKERQVIEKTLETGNILEISKQFYPMTRKFFIIAMVTNLLVMVIIILIIGRDMAWLAGMDRDQMNLMMGTITKTIFMEISFVIAVLLTLVINILYSYSKNLRMLFQTETGVLESVTNGDLSKLVPVSTSDEFGMIATYTNNMIHGLRDRIRMLTRLNVAKEVQENLLPNDAPDFPELDIAGKSLYCEEVGGDYFDYFKFSDSRVGIAVTDSSGHGVGAGLHMTSIRAFLRSGAEDYKGPAELIGSVNRHLVRDGYETGRFTTLFFADIDLKEKRIQWIRAGHDPALFYSPGKGSVEKLLGSGMALGVDADIPIHSYDISGWEKGSVLVILSDGLKESRNDKGEMYGEDRIIDVIRQQAGESARTIENRLIDNFNAFRNTMPIADDITVVVVKFLGDGTRQTTR